MTNKKIFCEECERKAEAVYLCPECHRYYCELCGDEICYYCAPHLILINKSHIKEN